MAGLGFFWLPAGTVEEEAAGIGFGAFVWALLAETGGC